MITREQIVAAAEGYWRRDKRTLEYFDAAGYAEFVLACRDAEVAELRAEVARLNAENRDACFGLNEHYEQKLAAAIAACKFKDDVIEFISNMSVLELSQLVKELEREPTVAVVDETMDVIAVPLEIPADAKVIPGHGALSTPDEESAATSETLNAEAEQTLAQLCQWVQAEHGVQVAPATMGKTLTRLGLTRKKRPFTRSNKSEAA